MASNGENQPLLSGLVDSTVLPNNAKSLSKRRLRRSKSAPSAEFRLSDIRGDGTLQRPNSIFGKIEPSIKNVSMMLGGYLGIGTFVFLLFRDDIEGTKTNPIIDAMYFCVVTMTTVGYGDLVPNTNFVKILACVFVFTGMAIVGLILGKAADYLVEKQEIMLVEALNKHNKVGELKTIKDIETNRVRYKCYLAMGILLMLMMVGATVLLTVEKMETIDAIYCVCSTITTLGFGDESFSTGFGRFFGIFWILISTLGLGQVFLYVAELFTETRQKALVNWVLTRKTTSVDLEAADMDNDGVVGVAEFILYKLKEMGKITEDDISVVMEQFENLDVDESGTLSVSDLVLSQSNS
ncbi:two-pore potassium channel 1 [Mercurialis annua]|uniref:two-pore potassium channel 1 n=1 Tax=Mercurialis annua TaxID=3986 RepID=UPI00215FA851|nr:two-pore potassium channel 1 [Mercurialis annua]XP_050219351.1 two-pore potassium channel 1 [Mercurialis annua]